jgi:tRNA dimethylallyltransferase
MPLPTLYLIAGPTASGKSAQALELAQRLNGVIINADAMQCYRDLPVLTAQPDKKACQTVPHRLYEVLDLSESGSVAHWRQLAAQEIAQTVAQGRIPILVGGTGLYFKVLLDGISEIPFISNEIRQNIKAECAQLGLPGIRAKLAKLDPCSLAKIKPNDHQRLLRAYEVVTATGKPLSWWHASGQRSEVREQFTIMPQLIMPERETLYQNCDRRFLTMMEQGAVEEVRALLARQLDPTLPAMKIIGVRELGAYLRGEWSQDEAIAKAQQATRNYAKRQLTWFRHQRLEEGS